MAGLAPAAGPVKPGSSGSGRLLPVSVVIDFASTVAAISTGVGLIFGVASLTDIGLIDKAICNILGLAYGIQIANAAVLVTNLFGLACQIVYLASDHHVKSTNASWLFFSLKLSALFDAGLYCFATLVPINILGHTITIFNVFLFAVPLTKLGTILRTRNASSLPTAMTFISVANNAVWSLYALMIQDIVVLLPSVLGVALSGFQVLVILWCQGTLPFDLGFLLLLCGSEVLPSSSPRKAGGVEEE